MCQNIASGGLKYCSYAFRAISSIASIADIYFGDIYRLGGYVLRKCNLLASGGNFYSFFDSFYWTKMYYGSLYVPALKIALGIYRLGYVI